MSHVLIVGLPKGAGQLLEREIRGRGLFTYRIFLEVGKKGSLTFVPKPEHCKLLIDEYVDVLECSGDYAAGHVVVLPYVSPPTDAAEEILTLAEMGATVAYPMAGEGDHGWPPLKSKRPDQAFEVALVKSLVAYLIEAKLLAQDAKKLPSEVIRNFSKADRRLLIANGALKHCDSVDEGRHDFLEESARALLDFLDHDGGGRFEDFCAYRSLNHAQNSDIHVAVKVVGKGIHERVIKVETHLKRGDATTPSNAPRVYYTYLDGPPRRVVILYAGPHPRGSFTCVVDVPDPAIPS